MPQSLAPDAVCGGSQRKMIAARIYRMRAAR
jgi:hypothetical protein